MCSGSVWSTVICISIVSIMHSHHHQQFVIRITRNYRHPFSASFSFAFICVLIFGIIGIAPHHDLFYVMSGLRSGVYSASFCYSFYFIHCVFNGVISLTWGQLVYFVRTRRARCLLEVRRVVLMPPLRGSAPRAAAIRTRGNACDIGMCSRGAEWSV